MSRSTTSKRFEELQLLREVQIGRIARRVGQRARVRDGPHERPDPSVVAAQLENLVDDGAVLALEFAGQAWPRARGRDALRSRRAARRPRRRPLRRGSRDGGPSATRRARGRRVARARTPPRRPRRARTCVCCLGTRSTLRVAAHVDRQRDRHARKHHRFIQGNDSQPVHSATRIVRYTLCCQLFI